MRNCIRRSRGSSAFSALSALCMVTAQVTASTTLANSASMLSPAELTNLPWCRSISESVILRQADNVCSVSLLIFPHEAAVAVNVGAQDSGELTLQDAPPGDSDT